MASKYSPRVTKPSSPEGKHQNMTLTLGAEPCGPTAPGGLPFVTALAKQCRKWWYFKVGPRPSHLCYTFSITSRLCLESSSTFPGGWGAVFFFFPPYAPTPRYLSWIPLPTSHFLPVGSFFFFFFVCFGLGPQEKKGGHSRTSGCKPYLRLHARNHKKVTTCVGIARSLSS